VLEAISPKYALDFLAHNQFHSLVILSSVILAITGVEALYADLGHFGARAIRWAWFVIVAPSLVMNYLGQAAEEIVSPRSANALFFNMAPNRAWLVYLVLLSTAATIIASQALISGVASISQQAIHLGIFPRLNIIHTSDSEFGQVYVPFMNALLGIGTILLVVIFKSSAHLANAYSFDISGTMLITTIGLGIVAVHRWHWGKYRSLLLCAFFGVIDLAFFASTSTKLLKGAWVPLLIALVILYFMIVWRHSNNVLTRQLKQSSIPLSEFTATCTEFNVAFTDSVGVYLTTDVESIPQAALTQIRQLHALPSSIFLVSVVTSEDPYGVSIVANYEANDLVSVLVVKVGYMESVDLPELLRSDVLGTRELAATYYLADRKFNNRNLGEITGVEESIFTFLHRNAVTASHYFGLPDDRVVTLAMQLDL
jgi:KUP system potassium uptake protein